MRGNLRTRKTVKRGSHVLARLVATESRSRLHFFAAIPGCWPGRTLPTTGCPRTSSPSASAGGKGTPRASLQQSPQATSGSTHGPASVTLQLHRRPLQGRDSPARSRTAPAPPATANRLPTALHAAVFGSRQPRSKPNAHLRRNPARDLSQRPESAYEDPLSPTISPTPISAASFRAVASSSPYQRARYSHGARVTPTSAMSCAFSAAVS